MRIDSNLGAQSLPESARTGNQPASTSAKAGSPSSSGISSPLREDQAQLSAVQAQIPAWVARAFQLPETSPEKVSGLRQAVLGGSYQPSPEQVAGAIFSNMVGKAA